MIHIHLKQAYIITSNIAKVYVARSVQYNPTDISSVNISAVNPKTLHGLWVNLTSGTLASKAGLNSPATKDLGRSLPATDCLGQGNQI